MQSADCRHACRLLFVCIVLVLRTILLQIIYCSCDISLKMIWSIERSACGGFPHTLTAEQEQKRIDMCTAKSRLNAESRMIYLLSMQHLESLSARLFWLNVRFSTHNVESKQFSVCHFCLHLGCLFFTPKILYTIFVHAEYSPLDLLVCHKNSGVSVHFFWQNNLKIRGLIMLLCSIWMVSLLVLPQS